LAFQRTPTEVKKTADVVAAGVDEVGVGVVGAEVGVVGAEVDVVGAEVVEMALMRMVVEGEEVAAKWLADSMMTLEVLVAVAVAPEVVKVVAVEALRMAVVGPEAKREA
jgi:hypothetical protein